MSKWIIGVIVLIIIIGSAWYWYTSVPGSSVPSTAEASFSAPSATTTPETGGSSASTISVSTDPTLGSYLVAGNGMALYEYSKDMVGMSMCTGTCAITWPPYVVASSSPLTAEDGVAGELTTIERNDGTYQVAYNGLPLYYYSEDTKPGDTTGENVGGTWTVAQP